MTHSDSEDEGVDDLEFDRTSDADGEEDPDIDDEALDAIEADAGRDDATEGDDDSATDDSEDGSDDDKDEDSEHSGEPSQDVDGDGPSTNAADATRRRLSPSHSQQSKAASPAPSVQMRSLSPAQLRKKALFLPTGSTFHPPRSYTVEAICALPHPTPTHALASSVCMTHLLTGSEDGYIRNYDIFTAVNGKNFLTAPQRHHCGVVEGIMKSGQIRFWWANPDVRRLGGAVPEEEEPPLSPVYSLLMHSDALWTLAGTDAGHINLFTLRHEPGRLCYVMDGHRGPVSALSMQHDEKGFFSAGWDGEALHWDLNTGQIARRFTAHGAQLAGIAVRPISGPYLGVNSPLFDQPDGQISQSATLRSSNSVPSENGSSTLGGNTTNSPSNTLQSSATQPTINSQQSQDAKSDASFDPLFDDEPDAEGEVDNDSNVSAQQSNRPTVPTQISASSNTGTAPGLVKPEGIQTFQSQPSTRTPYSTVAPPKNAPPLLDPAMYAAYSSDLLMTAAIDGQVILWDKRVHTSGKGVGRLWMSEKTPPWCLSACWSADGSQIYAGRRNGTVDVWDVRQLGGSGPTSTPRLLKTLRNPLSSGVVSCVVAFPDGRHIACASNDNIRLWNAAEAGELDGSGKMKSGVQFKIIPGHHGGYISQMLVDPGARFLVSASGNRGWHGDSTRTIFVHDIKHVQ